MFYNKYLYLFTLRCHSSTTTRLKITSVTIMYKLVNTFVRDVTHWNFQRSPLGFTNELPRGLRQTGPRVQRPIHKGPLLPRKGSRGMLHQDWPLLRRREGRGGTPGVRRYGIMCRGYMRLFCIYGIRNRIWYLQP